MSDLAGRRHLLFELGRGGMGTVYLAVSRGVGDFRKLKVVKQLRADLASHPHFLQAFLDEARLAARLNHPNVVQTNEVGFDGTHYFLEMEYLEGQSLEALLCDGGQLPLSLSLFVLEEVLAGLHYAHELTDTDGTPLGVVHRDVTPHNVFVTYEGVVKLLDFGIAKAANTSRDTSTGVLKGKLTYMSPEQASRRPVDRRADIFSVGVILWRLLTGRRLWEDASEAQIFQELDRGEIPTPSSVAGDVPPALEAICMRALALDPKERFGTAKDLQRALEGSIDGTLRVGSRALAERMVDRFAGQRQAVKKQIDARLRDESPVKAVPLLPALQQPIAARGASVTPTVSSGVERDAPPAKGDEPSRAGRETIGRQLAGLAALCLLGGILAFSLRGRWAPRSRPPADGRRGCATNAECIRQNDGRRFVCRKDDGACVPLETPRCTLRAEKGDVENDATIWIATMFPMTGEDAEGFGFESVNAADLARRDFMTIAHGIPFQAGDRPPRPIALITCDDAGDVERTASHLTNEVRVPAVVGFYSSQEVIDLAASSFIPAGVVAMATQNKSSLVTTIPHPPGAPRLVWRTTVSAAQSAAPVSAVVAEVLEPAIEPLLGAGEALRVALLRSNNAMGLSTSDAYFATLRFNGKNALDNGDRYRELLVEGDPDDQKDAVLVRQILEFKPHVVILPGVDTGATRRLLEPIEKGWRGSEALRPRYVVSSYILGDDFFAFLGRSAERRRRFLGVNPPSTTIPNAKLTMHYNESFSPKVPITASPGAVYDAVYVLAYAAYALGDELVSGTNLARAISRLVPPGAPVDVGPANIFDGFNALRAGRNIDLDGAATRLDFELTTGDSPTDFAVLCVGVDDEGRASQAVESEVTYRTATRRLDHLPLKCP
jgi:tRNA A-37 threonylcarbamoyl transferase component Bud32